MTKDNLITVSVVMITYGHEKYIEEAINGVLIQECNFEVELIIADDHSPDKTQEIVKEFIKNHPKKHWVKYTKHKVNKGMMPNVIWAFKQADGKYIASCEGDDYWTDPKKLQRQVDFLEANDDYSMTCHNALIIHQGIRKKPRMFSLRRSSQDIPMKTVINKWTIPTASMVFRGKYLDLIPDWFIEIYSGDYSLSLMLRHWGKIRYFKEIMSVYRHDLLGTSATATYRNDPDFVPKEHLKLLKYFNKETEYRYDILVALKKKSIEKDRRFMKMKQRSIIKAFIVFPELFVIIIINKIKITLKN